MRKQFILLKDSPELKAGAIVEEQCDDGTQDYRCISGESMVDDSRPITKYVYWKKIVETQPEWFEEVSVLRVAASKLVKVQEFISKL